MRGDTGGASARGTVFRGVHAVDWGRPAGEPVLPGQHWRWRGEAFRLDGAGSALWLGRPLARADLRPRARRRLDRLALAPPATTPTDPAPLEPPPGGLVLTDGQRLYPARLVTVGLRVAIVFDPWLPPPETDLWVAACAGSAPAQAPGRPGGIVAGALIETETGPRPVETLVPGDLVLTRDAGFQPLVWRGETRLSGAELALHPHLRPLRLAIPGGALGLAPGHRLVVPALPGMDAAPEALARAGDLLDGRRIRRDLGSRSVVYVHLMLAQHTILRVQGLEIESFHPGLADPVALRWHARTLERAAPGLTSAPGRYGDPVLRCLTRAEAALLMAA